MLRTAFQKRSIHKQEEEHKTMLELDKKKKQSTKRAQSIANIQIIQNSTTNQKNMKVSKLSRENADFLGPCNNPNGYIPSRFSQHSTSTFKYSPHGQPPWNWTLPSGRDPPPYRLHRHSHPHPTGCPHRHCRPYPQCPGASPPISDAPSTPNCT